MLLQRIKLNENRIFFYLGIMSFFLWLLPFVIRFFFEILEFSLLEHESQPMKIKNVITETIHLILNGDKRGSFILIFKTNIKSCFLNIIGGVCLGLGTFINLIVNGFSLADMFISSYNAGLSVESIVKVTFPHSFELIGFWLSGAIGFYIAWNIIRFMRGKESFTVHFYKRVGIYSLAVFFIILAAAYVEAYISTSFISQ
jgi:uncharacterized membrane protein SpoIIM required for sporulation